MQTKKRAKPVKFGKQAEKEETASPVKETEEKKVVVKEVEEPKEQDAQETPVEEKEETPVEKEDEPMEVRLSEPPKEETDDIFKDVEPTEEQTATVEPTQEVHASPESEPEAPVQEATQASAENPQEESPTQPEPTTPAEPEKHSPFGSFTYQREERRGKGGKLKSFIIIAIIAFLIGLGTIAGISYINSNQSSTLPFTEKTTPTPEPTKVPVATPTPDEVDLTKNTIQILNGSGITGEAAKVKTTLIDAGFKVGEVGNADTSDYTKTVIAAKKGVDQAYLTELTTLLKKSYSVNSVVETLPDVDAADVVITIGSTTAN